MRALSAARWATYALALTLCVPAFAKSDKPEKADKAEKAEKADDKVVEKAEKTSRTIAECTTFDQADKDDSAVTFTIHNSCSLPIDCAVSWRVVCAPDAKKRRSVHTGAAKLALALGTGGAADATASACGDDSWAIDSVSWSCQPNKD